MRTPPEPTGGDITEDAFLGGRLTLQQPRRGHRAGIEPVLIAAATPLQAGETVLDIGAGVGTAGLCALARVAGSRAVLVEADPALAALAGANIARNGLADRASAVVADVTRRGAARRAGLAGLADHALANPPFYEPRASRIGPAKANAHAAPAGALDDWVRFAAAALRPGGTLTLIHRAAALSEVLAAFGRRFGDARVLPVHPRPGEPASRIIVQARAGSRAPLVLLPGLVLHGSQGGAYTPAAAAVLRDAAPLTLAGGGRDAHL